MRDNNYTYIHYSLLSFSGQTLLFTTEEKLILLRRPDKTLLPKDEFVWAACADILQLHTADHSRKLDKIMCSPNISTLLN